MSKILIVDDSWLTRRGVKRILQAEGYEIIEAENGLQALELIIKADNNIDAVLLDLLMPEMSGLELLERLNLNHDQAKLPVVVLTADIQKTVRQKCIDLGVYAFLNKPPEPEELIEVVQNLLNRKADD